MLKEGNVVLLSDNCKYMVLKSLKQDDIMFYFVFKATGDNKNFYIIKENGNNFEFVNDENIMIKFVKLMNS